MPTYQERLSEVHKKRKEYWERAYQADPSLIRGVSYEGEAAREVPEKEVPLLTNIPGEVTRKRPVFFAGETPEEVEKAETAGAEKAILGRPKPKITFDKFGEPVFEEEAVTPSKITAPRGAVPSKEDVELNQKWMDFRENYFIPKIGYDPRKINPVQERIDTENSVMSQVDINALSVDQYTKLKKEAEKRGKQAEELANEKVKIGKDKETQAFELFKTDMASRQKETIKLSFKDINDYLYKMTHDSTGGSYELSPTDLTQLQQMAKESGYEIVEDIVTPGKERPFWFDEKAEKGYFVRPLGKTAAAGAAVKQYQHYAVNPQTGERIGWNGEKWERVQ